MQSAVQDSPIGVRPRPEAAEPPADPRPLPPRAPWVIRTPLDSLDARTMTLRDPDGRTHPLSVRQRLMLLILDGHCRNRCYCWVGNAELAAAYGCEERTNGIGETPFPVYPIPEAAGETAAPLGRSPPSFRGGFTVIPGRIFSVSRYTVRAIFP